MTYHHEVILAMELDRRHIGKLVQLITESWSMTGTLSRVDQHDNREWEVDYFDGGLIPSGGEIFAELWIGPWRGEVIGNQPVTVETVSGTLAAPERERLPEPTLRPVRPAAAIEGTILEDLPPTTGDVHQPMVEDARFTLCGMRVDEEGRWIHLEVKVSRDLAAVTCRECKRRRDLPL